jgi:AcrR family transcriptional regulator
MKKTPTQGRSRQTVEALVEATARTIAERGWQSTTTNHIAARAGVSVGSLYQYFASREDLLEALVERELGRLKRRMDDAIPGLLDADATTTLRAFLEIAFDHVESDEALFTELAHRSHETGAMLFVEGLEAYLLDATRLFLTRTYDAYEPLDVPAISFIISNGAMLVLMRFFSTRPKGVTKESLIEHIAAIYSTFLHSKLRKA